MIPDTNYKDYLPDLIGWLHLKDSSGLEFIERMDEGLSGAEVHLVEIRGADLCSGFYFLKLSLSPIASTPDNIPFNHAIVLHSQAISAAIR